MIIEIYLNDLKEEVQKEIIEALGGIGNYDVFPLAAIEINENEEGGAEDG